MSNLATGGKGSSTGLSTGVFGEQLIAEPTPIIQKNFVYGEPTDWEKISATGGSVTFSDNFTICQTGTSVGGYGVSRSNRSQLYKAGEGNSFKFTAIFDSTNALALSRQSAGPLNLTDAAQFGYDGVTFGVLHEYGGAPEIQTLTVTAAATGNEALTVTIAGTEYTVNVTSGSIQQNAHEIEQSLISQVSGYRFDHIGDTVVCQSENAATATNDFTLTGPGTCAGTFVQNKVGQATNKDWTPQTSWNKATLINEDGGFTLDPSKLNVYKVDYGYLGSAGIRYYVYNPVKLEWVHVHTVKFSNLNTTTLFTNPSMKVGWVAASLGSSGVNLTVKGASCESSIQGKRVPRERTKSKKVVQTSMGNTETTALAIRNRLVFGDKPNLGEIIPTKISVDTDQVKGGVFGVYLNTNRSTVTEHVEFASDSIAIIDTSKGTITGGTLIDSISNSGELDLTDNDLFLISRDELFITYTSNGGGGASDQVTVTITWREDL